MTGPGQELGGSFALGLLDLAPNILLIPGTRTRAHLAENLSAAEVRLDDSARAELARCFPARSPSMTSSARVTRSWCAWS